jgi:hypothetical protein
MFHAAADTAQTFYDDEDFVQFVLTFRCAACMRHCIRLADKEAYDHERPEETSKLIWPRTTAREPIAPEVPTEYAALAREAALVLDDSPRASGALSRRCLQQVLREAGEFRGANLSDEIDQAIESGKLPSYLTDSLHALREIGNMAAHPNKSKSTGEIIDVEPGEAEWSLDVLDGLFDFYFVQPAKTLARKAALDARLGRVTNT